MDRKLFLNSTIIISSFLIVTVFSTCNASNLQNGGFSDELNGWSVEYGYVSNGGGYALFQEHPIDVSSTLSQEFTIPDAAKELTFNIFMSDISGEDSSTIEWPDAFTASLLDPITLSPLISNPGFSDFFYIDNSGIIETVGLFSDNTVSLDVSGLTGYDALLTFDLYMSYDGKITIVGLDNVNISVVPAPGALLLSLTGLGFIRYLKRTKNSFKNT